MSFAVWVLAAGCLGVDVGWQPLPGGGMEYIIQIEPELLEALRRGEAVVSLVPPQVRDIRQYRIVVGRGPVPRITPARTAPPQPNPAAPKASAQEELLAEPAGEKPPQPSEPGSDRLFPDGRGSPAPSRPSLAPDAEASEPSQSPVSQQQSSKKNQPESLAPAASPKSPEGFVPPWPQPPGWNLPKGPSAQPQGPAPVPQAPAAPIGDETAMEENKGLQMPQSLPPSTPPPLPQDSTPAQDSSASESSSGSGEAEPPRLAGFRGQGAARPLDSQQPEVKADPAVVPAATQTAPLSESAEDSPSDAQASEADEQLNTGSSGALWAWLGLFLSLGGNIYLGLCVHQQRGQLSQLTQQLRRRSGTSGTHSPEKENAKDDQEA